MVKSEKREYTPVFAVDDPRVTYFVSRVGPQISHYLGCDLGCVAPLGTGGRFYGLKLYAFLTQEGKDVRYVELETGRGIPKNRREDVRGRKIVVVDDAIATGETYRKNVDPLKQQKDALGIIDVVVAVEYDMLGLADFAANRNGDKSGGEKGGKQEGERRGIISRLVSTYNFF